MFEDGEPELITIVDPRDIAEEDDSLDFSESDLKDFLLRMGSEWDHAETEYPPLTFYNNQLIEDIQNEILPKYAIPTSSSAFLVLSLCYKRRYKSRILGRVSGQSAATVRELRKLGFEFEMTGDQYLTKEKGVPYRQVIGWKDPKRLSEASIKLSPKVKKLFLKNKSDPFTGEKKRLEIDHRQPLVVTRKFNTEYPTLDSDLVESGDAERYYQPIGKTNNSVKRETCIKCVRGEKIPIPEWARVLEKCKKKKFKRVFTDNLEHNKRNDAPACAGCLFFDVQLMMNEDFHTKKHC